MKIIVSVTNDLTTDQRVHKVCTTLHNNGFDVLLIGRQLKNSVALKRSYNTLRLQLLFTKGFLFYAEFNLRLFFVLIFKKKHILLSNDLDTLLPNFLVSKIQRKKIVYDSHELFPEVPELVNRPLVKKTWEKLESFLLPKIKNSYTVCDSIKNYYNKKHKTNFITIKNLPLQKSIQPENELLQTKGKNTIIYQGALNVGRGLDLMIETMTYMDDTLLVIIGDGDISHQLKHKAQELSLEKKVIFMGKIAPKKLATITPNANVGISFEEDLGLNYRFALPNKIFDYIQAEVPILVSNLPEMKQVVNEFNVGEVLTSRKPEQIANQLKNMLQKDFSTQLKTAKSVLIWEHQEEKLLRIFKA